MTTEMSGSTLALVEITHWCENVLFLGWIAIFFVWSNPVSIALAIVVALLVYFLEIFIDNNFARVKWQLMFKSAWIVALVCGGVNLAVLAFLSERRTMGYSSKSPWVIHYDGSSCNGCDIEVLATLCPGFDGERFGVINTGNPKHADIFLVTGSVNEQNIDVVKEIYEQMVEPKVVVACGICACSGGIFHDCYNVIGGVDKAIPVDVYAPGCAVRPEALIDAIVEGIAVLDQKAAELKAAK